MKRKMFVVSLVLIGLGVLVVEGVSQPTPSPFGSPASVQHPLAPTPTASLPQPALAGAPAPNFSVVQPSQPEWTFEQLVEALKGVRARQKELQAQEADLLAKLAKKVEEKREDLSKSEATLQQLRSENGRINPPARKVETKTDDRIGYKK